MARKPRQSRLTLDSIQPMVISSIMQAGGEATVREIAEAIGRTGPRTTQIVNQLVTSKVLKRAGKRLGGRGKAPSVFALSAKGKKLAETGPTPQPSAPKRSTRTASKTASPKTSAAVPAMDSAVLSQLAEAVQSLVTALSGFQSNGMTFSLTLGDGSSEPSRAAPVKAKRRTAKKSAPAKKRAAKKAKEETQTETPEKVAKKAASKKKAAAKKAAPKKKAAAKKKAASKKKAAPRKAPARGKSRPKKERGAAAKPAMDSNMNTEEPMMVPEAPAQSEVGTEQEV